MKFLLAPIKITWSILVFLTPVLGVWLASSLTSYLDGPMWLGIACGAALFPGLPLLWEFWGSRRFEKRQARREEAGKDPRKKWLTFWDRFILRTLLINLLFLGSLLAAFPQQSFLALTTRGDWMLQNKMDDTSVYARSALFQSANGLEWLYNLTRENPYEKYAPTDQDDIVPKPNPLPAPIPIPVPSVDPTPDPKPDPDPEPVPDKIKIENLDQITPPDPTPVPDPPTEGRATTWPITPTLHPAVTEMPKSVETSIKSVAEYIKSKESDPFLRVKALNDYVADRVVYDAPALARGDYPPQDAETVFKTRKAVCAGYAKLMIALGKVTGDKMVYVVGVSRDGEGNIAGGAGHAWNAAEINGAWYLIDTTWNAGHVKNDKFIKSYDTDHLFTPPHIFGVDHFPDKPKWQLRNSPITRGEFVRQPMMKPGFYANGLELVSPDRSLVSVSGKTFVIKMKNPHRAKLLGTIQPKAGGKEQRCDVDEGTDASITCTIDGSGTYFVKIFAVAKGRTYPMVGRLAVMR